MLLEQYIQQAKKIYEFKIGVAGEQSDDFTDKLESCLQKYGLLKLSPGKKTPLQERPLDFPNLKNERVTYFEVELELSNNKYKYCKNTLAKCCDCHRPRSWLLFVIQTSHARRCIKQPKPEGQKVYQSKLLTQEDIRIGTSAQST